MLEGWKALLGQADDEPEQVSWTSQLPADVRHTVPDAEKASAGQADDEPEQVS